MFAAIPAAMADGKKIGLAVANLQQNFFNQIKQSVEAYGKELGVEVITVDARGDPATQVSQVQDLITQKIDALIYIPAGTAAAAVPVKAAQAAGVPVVNVDRNAFAGDGITFIATDSVASAKAVGLWLCQAAGGKGRVAIVHGEKGSSPEIDRTKGFMEAVAECPGFKVVAEQWSQQWSQDEGFKIVQDMLQADPEIDVIFGQSDSMALGAAQAVKIANLDQRVWIGGFDGDTAALEAIQRGVFDVTATQKTQGMGRMALEAALDLAGGKQVAETQLLNAAVTTKDNVGGFIAVHP
ncbi:MAG: substrate-binding domain-containing protein [Parvibaculaceae bacterium]